MSAAQERLNGDLRGPATAWLRAKAVEGPSPATQAARRADLAGVAACLADVLERPDAGLAVTGSPGVIRMWGYFVAAASCLSTRA